MGNKLFATDKRLKKYEKNLKSREEALEREKLEVAKYQKLIA